MAKSKDIFDISDIKKRFDKVLETVAFEVGLEIETAFEDAITEFYNSYTPSSYRRTESLYKLSTGYTGPGRLVDSALYTKIGEMKYRAGISVDPSIVGHNPYAKKPKHGLDVDPEWVFNVSYLKGIHGFNRSNVINRKDGWKPGYLTDADIASTIFKSAGMVDKNTFEKIKTDFSRFYDIRKHTPKNSTPPDKIVRDKYKTICKNIGLNIDRAMASFSI